MPDMPLNISHDVACAALIPAAVEVLGDAAQLDDEILTEGRFRLFFLAKAGRASSRLAP